MIQPCHFWGRIISLRIISNQETGERISFVNGEFLVYNDRFKPSKKKIKLLYEKWLVKATIRFIKRRIELYSKELAVTPQKFKLKKLRSRWGSTTTEGAIHAKSS